MKPRSVLVTGAAGFIGSRMVQTLRAQASISLTPWTRQLGDLRDSATVVTAMARLKPDTIYHLAAGLPGKGLEDASMIEDEKAMLGNLAYAMPLHCRLIYSGSMAEYGRSGILAETDQCCPDSVYGRAKLGGTTLALSLRQLKGLDVRVARLFGVYGPGEAPSRLFPALIRALREGRRASLSDGLQKRDFVHVDDVCKALQAVAESDGCNVPEIVNVGTGVGVRVRDACIAVAQSMGADPTLLQFGAAQRRPTDQDILIADTRRLRPIMSIPSQRWLDPVAVGEIVSEFERAGSEVGEAV